MRMGSRQMQSGRAWPYVLATLALLCGVGFVYRIPLLIFAAPWIQAVLQPIGPTMVVPWSKGPAQARVDEAERPNIVLIVADDLGYNDITWRSHGAAPRVAGARGVGAGTVPTPNIDALAREGVDFTQGYTGNATCAPSRAAIMTGRYATRFGYEFTPTPGMMTRYLAETADKDSGLEYFSEFESQVPPFEQLGVPTSEVTLAEALKARGYHTVGMGKWHLGESDTTRAISQGFDEFLGTNIMHADPDDPNIVNSRQDFDPIDKFLWRNMKAYARFNAGPRFLPPRYNTDFLADEAVRVIAANRNRPLFLYLAFYAPHTPLQATRADYDALPQITNHRERVYGAMVRALDRGVGKVLAQLKAQGLDRNTLVIFTSDNGGADYVALPEINKPFRGWKMTFFEGGIRAPFFVRWPAVLPAGSYVDAPVGHIDIFPTALAAANGAAATGSSASTSPPPSPSPPPAASPSAGRKLDGVDLLPYALGQVQGVPHQSLFWRSGQYSAIRVGDWKLQRNLRPNQRMLFDLRNDPTEQHDLAASQPVKLASMTAELDRVDASMAKPLWPALLESPHYVDHTILQENKPGDVFVTWPN